MAPVVAEATDRPPEAAATAPWGERGGTAVTQWAEAKEPVAAPAPEDCRPAAPAGRPPTRRGARAVRRRLPAPPERQPPAALPARCRLAARERARAVQWAVLRNRGEWAVRLAVAVSAEWPARAARRGRVAWLERAARPVGAAQAARPEAAPRERAEVSAQRRRWAGTLGTRSSAT